MSMTNHGLAEARMELFSKVNRELVQWHNSDEIQFLNCLSKFNRMQSLPRLAVKNFPGKPLKADLTAA